MGDAVVGEDINLRFIVSLRAGRGEVGRSTHALGFLRSGGLGVLDEVPFP